MSMIRTAPLALALTALGLATSAHAADAAPAAPPAPPIVVLPPAPAAPVSADMAARLSAAAKLVEVMHLDKQLEGIMPQFIAALLPMIVRGNTGHEEQIRQILGEELNTAVMGQRPAFMQLYRDVYARNFTLKELEGMNAFYSSEVGQSVLAKTPKLTQDSMQGGEGIGRKAAMEALPRIFARMQAAQLAIPKGT